MKVDIGLIDAAADNPREHLGELGELAASIRAQGVLQPIVVQQHGDRFLVIAGHRRLAAAKRAGLTEVPVALRPPMGDQERLAAMVSENVHRRTLNGRERALAYQAMIDTGMSQKQVAAAVGLTQATISNTIDRWLRTPQERAERHTTRERRREAGLPVHGRPVEATPAECLRRLTESARDGLSCYLTPGLSKVALALIREGAQAVARERAAA